MCHVFLASYSYSALTCWAHWDSKEPGQKKQAAAENNTGINILYYCKNPSGLKTLFSCVWQGAPESKQGG